VCLVLRLKVVLKKGGLPCKTFGLFVTKGKRRGVLHQSGPVLYILNTKGCIVPRRSGLSRKCPSDVHGRGTCGLYGLDDVSCLGHLYLQSRNICAALG
jgi:hypothetical protein